MTIEQAPQNRLKTALAKEQGQVTALQQLNSTFAALQKSADSFSSGSTWTKLTATSSNTAIKVSATSDATPAQLALSVTHAATAAQNTYTVSAALSDIVTAATSLDVTLSDGTTTSVALSDGKLSTVISALNGTKNPDGSPALSATAISDGSGGYRLVVNQLTTGDGTLSVNEAGGGALMGGPDSAVSKAGSNASITAGGVPIEQRSNTFKALMPGVDVTITAAAEGATSTLSISDDGSSRANALSTFVSQINQAIDAIASTTSYGTISSSGGAASTGAGALPGDSTLRDISTRLLNTIFPGDDSTMAKMGLDLDRDGHLTFNQTTFQAAYQADPSGVQAAFIGADGFTSRVSAIAAMASDPSKGLITQTIAADNKEIKRYNDEIADWDDRLTAKEASLTQQYTALEVLLSKLQSQQSWLTAQFDAMSPSKDK